MTKRLDESYIGHSVSHGTLVPKDLIEAFEAFAKEHGLVLTGRPIEVSNLLKGAKVSDESMALIGYYLDMDLFDLLDSIAPKGSYFGANEGDGSDFGYWPASASRGWGHTLVEFRWVGDQRDDPLDYVAYAYMTAEQREHVSEFLRQAEEAGRIHPEWYVGDLGGTTAEKLIADLEEVLS